jgi:hypothetical protein
MVKRTIPAKEIHILLISESEKIVETITLSQNIKIDMFTAPSMLLQCYESKEALFSNDIDRDKYYNSKIDNFLDYPLKNLLLTPLLSEENKCLGIIWAVIPKKDLNQYTQLDLRYMTQLSVVNEKMFVDESKKLEENIEVNKSYEEKNNNIESDSENNASMVKRLKSWLFK